MTRFEIQTYCLCGGWTNTWTINDSEPETFDSFADALATLDDFLDEMAQAHFNGEIEDQYDRNDYRIVEVKNV